MSRRRTSGARLPDRGTTGLPGLDPAWSRLVTAVDDAGVARTWHVLDAGEARHGTLLCVHGNPTWSYLWRRVLATAPPGWRVVAVDQLGMGWSERTEDPRPLAQRISDLGSLSAVLGVEGPVVTVAHDWGGPISLGWALEHRAQLAGVVLANTGVHQPAGSAAPALIRTARARALRETVCVRTPLFMRAATALSRPALPTAVRRAFAAPYGEASRRAAVGDFVADIPLGADHPSAARLAAVAAGLADLRDVPALVLWGARDPVFSDRYLRDLLSRLPHAQVQRWARASHLVTEDAAGAAELIWAWVDDLATTGSSRVRTPPGPGRPLWAALEERGGDPAPAVVEVGAHAGSVSFATLAGGVRALAAGLSAEGLRPGQRVALLVPPGADLTTAVYGCWRAGAVIVVADAGLGLRGMGAALRSASPDLVIGSARGLAAARLMRLPGRRRSVADLVAAGRDAQAPAGPAADDECAVVFTSGATGPAKGVVYRHHQVQAQLAVLAATYGITPADRMVAAFAPFALYGPALGIASAVPDVDVTKPATLTAAALAEASAAVDATVVFASPAALRNVLATAGELGRGQRDALAQIRLVMSAGAPVPVELLRALRAVLPGASLHTPYGMTEVLPVTDVSLEEIAAAGEGDGVCVGRPVLGVKVSISPLDALGRAGGALGADPDVAGEVCVRAAHVKDRYDRLWAVERDSSRDTGWHRTGDVGHLDDAGRLWVEGRLLHVVSSAAGPVTPVGVERRVEVLAGVRSAAVVGVGPRGTQQVVVVVVPEAARPRRVLADPGLSADVRRAAGVPVAAVLLRSALPVDIRHNAKIDRIALAAWASRVLAGGARQRGRDRT